MDKSHSQTSSSFPVDDPQWQAIQKRILADANKGKPLHVEGFIQQYPQYRERIECLLPRIQARRHQRLFFSPFRKKPPVMKLAPWQPGEKILEDFTVERELGTGGFGQVYLVHNNLTNYPYAVKRISFRDTSNKLMTRISHGTRFLEARKRFLQELIEWIDLPEHMNLVPCYFFRTLEDEILIFAAYQEGGSLAHHIETGKLYKGNSQQILERILDIAIQSAWGLHCLHSIGVVHMDVKPDNILFSNDLAVRIGDFGLAKARAASLPSLTANSRFPCSGFTVRYGSPEQLGKLARTVTLRTDLWSWGLTVLEMFSGKAFWSYDHSDLPLNPPQAMEGLQDYITGNVTPRSGLTLPQKIEEILQHCFQYPFQDDFKFTDIIDGLKSGYEKEMGRSYPKILLPLDQTQFTSSRYDRKSVYDQNWRSPHPFLKKTLAIKDESSNTKSYGLLRRRFRTRRGQTAADLHGYEDVYELYEKHLTSLGLQEQKELAELCINKSIIHDALEDFNQALKLTSQAIDLLQKVVDRHQTDEDILNLAKAYMQKGYLYNRIRDVKNALSTHAQVISLLTPRMDQDKFAFLLAIAYVNQAISALRINGYKTGIKWCDQALEILKKRSRLQTSNLLQTFTWALTWKGSLYEMGGKDPQNALSFYDQAIGILDFFSEKFPVEKNLEFLASLYENKCTVLYKVQDPELTLALSLIDKAILYWERLVFQENRETYFDRLASAYVKKAEVLLTNQDETHALEVCQKGIRIFDRLFNQLGCTFVAGGLAYAYQTQAKISLRQKDFAAALAASDQAVQIREYQVRTKKQVAMESELSWTFTLKSRCLKHLGQFNLALQFSDQALFVLENLCSENTSLPNTMSLAMVYRNKAAILRQIGDLHSALQWNLRAIQIWQTLLKQHDHAFWKNELAEIYTEQTEICTQLGDTQRAKGWQIKSFKLWFKKK